MVSDAQLSYANGYAIINSIKMTENLRLNYLSRRGAIIPLKFYINEQERVGLIILISNDIKIVLIQRIWRLTEKL